MSHSSAKMAPRWAQLALLAQHGSASAPHHKTAWHSWLSTQQLSRRIARTSAQALAHFPCLKGRPTCSAPKAHTPRRALSCSTMLPRESSALGCRWRGPRGPEHHADDDHGYEAEDRRDLVRSGRTPRQLQGPGVLHEVVLSKRQASVNLGAASRHKRVQAGMSGSRRGSARRRPAGAPACTPPCACASPGASPRAFSWLQARPRLP